MGEENNNQGQLDVALQDPTTQSLIKERFIPANVARSGNNIFGTILGNVEKNTRAASGIDLSKPFNGYCFYMIAISAEEFEERVGYNQYRKVITDNQKIVYEYFVYAPEISGCLIIPDIDFIVGAFETLKSGPGSKDVKDLIKSKATSAKATKEIEKLDMFPRFYSTSDRYARKEVKVQLFNKADFTKGMIMGFLTS